MAKTTVMLESLRARRDLLMAAISTLERLRTIEENENLLQMAPVAALSTTGPSHAA